MLIAYPANISRNKPDNVDAPVLDMESDPVLPDKVTLRDAADKLTPLAKKRVVRANECLARSSDECSPPRGYIPSPECIPGEKD